MRGLSSAVIVAVVLSVTAGNRHQQELKEHYDHLAYIAEYNCQWPQPRVISVHELFPEKDTEHKAFFPDVTVLHRCDNAVGCCPSNHVCRPKHTQPLHLPFKVTFLEHMGKQKKGSWIIDYHTFDNHTECECVDSSVCVPVTEHADTVIIGAHKPDQHSESSHHQSETHHEPDQHSESSHHQSESHHEPDQHSESSQHQSESHHEPDQQSESHHEQGHEKTPDYHTESTHNTEKHSSSYNPPSETSPETSYNSESSSSPSSSDNEQQESSTLPLLVNYVLSSTSSSTTEKITEQDISSFFD